MENINLMPIGIMHTELGSIKDNIIYIINVDIFDKAPLLDIKSYILDFDKIYTSLRWVENKIKKNHLLDRRFD